MYSGMYNGSKRHEIDLQQVLNRSWSVGLSKIFITGGNLEESKKALELAQLDGNSFVFIQNTLIVYPHEKKNSLFRLQVVLMNEWMSTLKCLTCSYKGFKLQ